MNLALFDFDGTISNKDSMFTFIQFAVGKPSLITGLILLSPMLLSFKLGFINNQTAKHKLLQYFFKNWSQEKFNERAQAYASTQLQSIIRHDALDKIKWHQQQGDTVCVVSASLENWLLAWCEEQKITLVATQYDMDKNEFISLNCANKEKVNRIKRLYKLDAFEKIYAYGDSSGDKDMLAFADHAFYRYFKG